MSNAEVPDSDDSTPHPHPSTQAEAALFRMASYLLAATASAVLLALASPPLDHSWLAWLAPAPFFWALLRQASAETRPVSRKEFRGAAWTGFFLGAEFLFFLVPWFAAFTPVGYGIACVCWGLLFAAMAGLTVVLLRRAPAIWSVPILAASWTALEWVRAQGVLAFPWGTLSVTQYRNLPALQLLDLTGSYGLTFLMALSAAVLAAAAVAFRPVAGVPRNWRTAVRWGAATTVLVAATVVRGALLLGSPPSAAPRTRVAVIQASESRNVGGVEVHCYSNPRDYASRTQDAMMMGAELVVWPESACEDDAAHDPETRKRLSGLLAGTRSHLLTGSFVQDPATRADMNAAVLTGPDGRVEGQYAKVRIVPFGEYIPARALVERLNFPALPRSDLQPGRAWRPIPWTRGSVGVSICFESAFGPISRELANHGANLLAVLTSDGWAGRAAVGMQHLAFAPLRAVETRRAVARAAATGVSELIDPYGRVLRSVRMFDKGIATAELPLREDRTLYCMLGDWPVGLSWLVLLLAFCSRRKPAQA